MWLPFSKFFTLGLWMVSVTVLTGSSMLLEFSLQSLPSLTELPLSSPWCAPFRRLKSSYGTLLIEALILTSSSNESFIMPLLTHLCAAFTLKMRRLLTTYFSMVTSQWKVGLSCSQFSNWTSIFLVRQIVGCLMGSIVKLFVRRGTSCGDALLDLFCGAFGMREIVDFFFMIKYDSFWTVVQCLASWWSKYTKYFCNYSLSMAFNNWKSLIC